MTRRKPPPRKPRPKTPRALPKAPRTLPKALQQYSAKRAFEATPEPAPAPAPDRSGPLLFVVQQHAARRLHFDFRLEADGVLKSWAVPKGPSLNPADKRLAVPTEDHTFEYASFEGVIPEKQYGAGEVIVWDCGPYSPDEDHEYFFHDRAEAERRVLAGLEKGKLSIFLRGVKLKGSFALVRTSDRKSWLLIKHKDRFVDAGDVTARGESVLSGMPVEALKRRPARERIPAAALAPAGPPEALPAKLSPMLAEIGDSPAVGAGWRYEPKLDGYRVLAFVEGDRVVLRSRRGLDYSAVFPDIASELGRQLVATMVLDGEIVAFGPDGRPSFDALQDRAQMKTAREIAAAEQATPTAYVCFDILHFAGVNLRAAPYESRRRYLAQCLLPSARVQLVHADDDAHALYDAALASGFEGIMAKRRDSPYLAGKRSGYWLKVKSTQSAEFVVGGYTTGKGARASLGALLLGVWEAKDRLRYVGHVGSGFDDATLAGIKPRLEQLKAAKSPFTAQPPLNGPATWLAPELVAEVKFAEWTDSGHLRAPVFLRLRDDVDPRAVKRTAHPRTPTAAKPAAADSEVTQVLHQLEDKRNTLQLTVGAARIKLTNLDRVYWPADPALDQPALTKRDLLRYLTRVSRFMLPHLADRPLTMIRMPEGIRGERFFQKHWRQARPDFVRTVTVFSETKDESHEYLLCNDLATLLWVAQSGTLEFHVWHSRCAPGPDAPGAGTDFASSLEAMERSVLNYPDYLVFDIDPYIYSGKEPKGAEPELNLKAFEKGKEVAFWLRELLQGMSLEPIVKTSGKTGLHVFVPIERTLDFDAARQTCEMVGRHLLRQHPRDITMEWSVEKRTGKIFIDYNMNVRGKTLNVAYSPRGVPGAPVSMPLAWDELVKAHPLDFRLTNAPERLERTGDRWQNALRDKQSLEEALERSPA
jgi:bifunctional non-homologous end joining protein LigD